MTGPKLTDAQCDGIARVVKAMLSTRTVERTNDAMWRSVIRLGVLAGTPDEPYDADPSGGVQRP